jgi:hypothetical protein
MAPQPSWPDPTTETVPLEVRRIATIDVLEATRALVEIGWLGTSGPTADPHTRSVTTELVLPVFDGSASSPIRKSAVMEIGLPRSIRDTVAVDISWRSATFAPLFPVFSGELLVSRRDVILVGRYAPPFGHIGLLMDRGLLHFVARRTAVALVGRFVDRFRAASEPGIES